MLGPHELHEWQWQLIYDLFPSRRLPDVSDVTQGRRSTRSSGSCAAVLLGETFRSVMVLGKAPTTGTASGRTTAPLTASWSGSRSGLTLRGCWISTPGL